MHPKVVLLPLVPVTAKGSLCDSRYWKTPTYVDLPNLRTPVFVPSPGLRALGPGVGYVGHPGRLEEGEEQKVSE
ncbi:unnamed protein product [Fusarium graminearum]|uniref:Uncharacterized protein n=1 Tax=Gibberella zeae TaxID=5518 RepID=A0A4U9ER38_GIBZA|nr:unnamed protein product [Fusarium graminearum]CAF3502936.1 unnamed protein product [Fusarium graminearum]CAF3532064.1 unnamed protein product [Fusarium graminearum]CAG1967898.1 unnamed protein product [Fusarium graminearum]CAG1976947.1 unnamed protein product [Fusarium graminearum]